MQGINTRAVFLDTSIQIARFVHGPLTKRKIAERLRNFSFVATSLVVRQEFKRRLLKEARYLLEQLNRRGSLEAVQRHVVDVLPPQQRRKQQIWLDLITTIFEGESDINCTERARLFLRSLLRGGLDEFDELVDHVIESSRYACGLTRVAETAPDRFETGPEKCSKVRETCGVRSFLAANLSAIESLRRCLGTVPIGSKSQETSAAEQVLEDLDTPMEGIEDRNLCLTAGDLMIAIESASIPAFYTMNGKESQHLCRALQQDLIVRSPNPDRVDVICARDDEAWPHF